ncbi:L,D-transpeptidase family protein [Stappia indica]|uniref:L,D-transpeptidase family protein n=1 Tax=Stappia indica TaxID=538381 RepID=UPI001D1949EE|nr:murein L,D-transpeptidase family protein [Stappia indica]MCC4244498.1 murein L,D-transpeptidase [Stappia indica]
MMVQGIARLRKNTRRTLVALALAGALAGCQADEMITAGPKHLREISASIKQKMPGLDMSMTSPIMLRIFKEESTLEVWKQTRSGRYALLETFEICKWSGELGPKIKEGDRQAPEGFYEITPALMNPNSSYHLAFNLGYPNKFDRSHNRTGTHLMVHGACSSRGCYAMTDQQVQDIYALARESFKGGQRSFQVQAFPFRMTAENLAKHRKSEHYEFWRMLKSGYDHFEVTKQPPKIDVCEKRYVFDAVPLVEGVPFRATAKCPEYDVPDAIEVAVAKKQRTDDQKIIEIAEAEERSERRRAQIAALFGNSEADKAGESAETATGEAAPAAGTSQPVAVAATSAAPAAAAATAPAATATAAAAPAATADAATQQTAFAPTEQKSSGGFFSRLFSGGDSQETEAADGTPDPNAPVPAAKP